MRFDLLLTGVGGEGVLTAGVLIARAANLQGYFVRGIQLHGLAQRGGTIPTVVRFGSEKEISSPGIMQANSDLVIAFEPLEAVRACYYARKEKTVFVINDWPHMPVYANLLNLPYPSMEIITKRVKPFAKKIHVLNTHDIAKKEFGKTVLGNTMLIGAVCGAKLLPLKEKYLKRAIKLTAPREEKDNLKAFEIGLKIGKKN